MVIGSETSPIGLRCLNHNTKVISTESANLYFFFCTSLSITLHTSCVFSGGEDWHAHGLLKLHYVHISWYCSAFITAAIINVLSNQLLSERLSHRYYNLMLRSEDTLVARSPLFCTLLFAFTIIHGSGRAVINRKFVTLLLLCIIVNANCRVRNELCLGTRLR